MRDTVQDLLIAIAGGAFDQHDRVLEILKAAFAVQDGIVDPPSSVTRMTVEGVIRDAGNGDLLTAETPDGEILGCLFTKIDADDAGRVLYAYHLAVEPMHQGKGIGHRLFDTVVTLAKARNVDRLQVMSRIELTDVHTFFTNMGFRQVDTFTHDGFDRPTSLRFEKAL